MPPHLLYTTVVPAKFSWALVLALASNSPIILWFLCTATGMVILSGWVAF